MNFTTIGTTCGVIAQLVTYSRANRRAIVGRLESLTINHVSARSLKTCSTTIARLLRPDMTNLVACMILNIKNRKPPHDRFGCATIPFSRSNWKFQAGHVTGIRWSAKAAVIYLLLGMTMN